MQRTKNKSPRQKRVKVLDYPETFILIDADKDADEAKANWLEKHNFIKKPLSQGQINRERDTVRGGKVYQRAKYK